MTVRSRNRWRATLFAALTAYAQIVMAAEPCMMLHAPATPVQHEMTAGERCDAMPMDQAACVAQCLGDDESVSTFAPFSAAAIVAAPAVMDFTLSSTRCAVAWEALYTASGGPSLQILYCSYQS